MCSLSHTPLYIYTRLVGYTIVHVHMLCYVMLSHLNYVNEDILDSEWLYIHVVRTHVVILMYSWDNFNNPIPHAKVQQESVYVGLYFYYGARGGVVGWGTMQQAGMLRVRFPMKSLDCFNWPNQPAALWPWGGLSL
jgi:hypothetical protein